MGCSVLFFWTPKEEPTEAGHEPGPAGAAAGLRELRQVLPLGGGEAGELGIRPNEEGGLRI